MRKHLQQHKGQRGFSLIEILVGMVVGLVVTIIIYQVVATNEGVKRTTTAGADTQQNGIFSLTTIERDIRAAGWGIPAVSSMVCTIFYTYFNDGATSGPVPNFPGTALRITDGGTAPGASDSITMMWGSSVRANVPNTLLQNVTLIPTGTAAASIQPASKVGVSGTGGFMWVTDDTANCMVAQITAVAPNPVSPTTVILSHDPVVSPSPAQPNYNAPASFMTANAWPVSFNANVRMFDVGALTQRTYSIVNGSLMAQDRFSSAENMQVSNNVVSLKAQYGISDAGGQTVNKWVSATVNADGNWALPTANDMRRVKAVHLAVVVRSPLKEKPTAGTSSCATTTVAPTSWPGGPVIDLSNDPDWMCYRYRTFETVVPMRNVLWANLS